MSVFDRFRRKKGSNDELREEEEARVRAAEELRKAEQDSERSRGQSKVPGPSRNMDLGGGGF
jgi:hypothetical protein